MKGVKRFEGWPEKFRPVGKEGREGRTGWGGTWPGPLTAEGKPPLRSD